MFIFDLNAKINVYFNLNAKINIYFNLKAIKLMFIFDLNAKINIYFNLNVKIKILILFIIISKDWVMQIIVSGDQRFHSAKLL